MRRRLIAATAVAVTAALAVGLIGLLTPAFTDYEVEAEPSFSALRAGDLDTFFRLLPSYGGSLVLRAPFVLLGDLWGGGALTAFRMAAVPALAAGVALGLVLFRTMRGGGAWLVLLLAAANPITVRALEVGHPEELLGAVLCVAAVLAALRERPALAGVLLGLAVANKAWAVLAIGPVLLALGAGRWRATGVAAVVAALILAPIALLAGRTGAPQGITGAIFHPQQVWWFFGAHGEAVQSFSGLRPGYRVAPDWLNGISHPLIVLLAVPLSAVWWRGRHDRRDALGLLVLLMLLRCVLDPWDSVYYALPFLLALLAWDALDRQRVPWATLTATLLVWVSFELAPQILAPDGQAVAYLGWAVPACALVALRLFAPARAAALRDAARTHGERWLPTLARRAAPRVDGI